MIVIDVNLLIYAINDQAPMHVEAKQWLETQLSSSTPIGLPWLVIIAFLRLSTNPRIFGDTHLASDEAIACMDRWLGHPNVIDVHPGPQHWQILNRLLMRSGAAGNLTNDAHIAALAIEHAALVCSTDNDFKRFQGVQHINPLSDPDAVHEPMLS
jgi:toxin-antitoxin system PIN domain toxin